MDKGKNKKSVIDSVHRLTHWKNANHILLIFSEVIYMNKNMSNVKVQRQWIYIDVVQRITHSKNANHILLNFETSEVIHMKKGIKTQ